MMTEAGYYFTHLLSAVAFIDTLEAKSLSIDPEEFNRCARIAGDITMQKQRQIDRD
jgi:hypothetical protein